MRRRAVLVVEYDPGYDPDMVMPHPLPTPSRERWEDALLDAGFRDPRVEIQEDAAL